MSMNCFLKANLTPRQQVKLFDLPIDTKGMHDIDIQNQMRMLGFDPDKMTVETIQSAQKAQKTNLYRRQQQALAQVEINRSIKDYKGKPQEALVSLLVNDLSEISNNISTEKVMMSMVNLTHAKMHEFMGAMAPDKTSMMRGIFTGKAINGDQERMLRDVVDEIFKGESGNSTAKKFAKSVNEALDSLNNRHQKASGDTETLSDWGLPQRHDSIKIGKKSFDEWVTFIGPRLDVEKMSKRNPELADPEAFDFIMKKVYDTLRTDGLSKLDDRPIIATGKGDFKPNFINPITMSSINFKHQSNRFLQFKDGKSWMEYQNEFGSGSVYQTITDHILAVSRETSLMEKFGPNHEAGFAYAKTVVQKATGSDLSTKTAESYYDAIRLRHSGTPTKTAQILKAMRDWNVATKLGGAALSAQTDHAFAAQTAMYNGLSATRMLKQYIKQLSHQGREEAAKVALTGEFAIDRMTAAFEYQNAMNTGRAKAMGDFVMRVTGMEAHTVAMRQAFGVEFLQAISDQSHLAFDKLPVKLRKAYIRYGIDEKTWEVIRTSTKAKVRGVDVMDPTAISDPDVQTKLLGMILTETDFAVPTPGARERAITSLGTEAGTVHGEVIRNFAQFTSFPVTANIKHIIGRGIKNKTIDTSSKMGYAASLAITTTLLGALVHQAKQIAAGKEPKDWDDLDFWLKAADQGGYFGLVGSFLLNTEGYYSGYSGGPIFDGPIQDLAYTLVAGNIQKIKEGKDTTFSKDATNFLIKNFPGNNIWYTRLAMDRMIFDQLRKASDPDYQRNLNKRIRKMRRDKNQKFWWKPAKLRPER